MLNKIRNLGIEKYIDLILLIFLISFPLLASPFRVELMSKCVIYLIFALSLDILWGSAGLMNLGHAMFFGLGGYVLALSYAVKNGVPAFMVSFGVTELPWFMQILQNQAVAFLLGLLVPGAVAALLGYFIFTSRVKGVFFNIITLALASLIELFFNNQQKYTGRCQRYQRFATTVLWRVAAIHSGDLLFGAGGSSTGVYFLSVAE